MRWKAETELRHNSPTVHYLREFQSLHSQSLGTSLKDARHGMMALTLVTEAALFLVGGDPLDFEVRW